jgi:NADP-dependent 3-hydroxy acid dehydrogenase YdfG
MNTGEYVMNFKNKTALVTGASVGIGRAVALKLAQYGAKVVLFDIDYEKLEKTKKEVTNLHKHDKYFNSVYFFTW